MRRGEKVRHLTDKRILRSVLDIALSKGEHAVTMESVSKQSGVAKTTLYRRYKNCADMLAQLEKGVESRDFGPSGFEATPAGLEKYALWLETTYADYITVPEMASLMFARTPFLMAVGHKILSELVTGMIRLIEEGQRAGAFLSRTKPELAADLIVGGVLFAAQGTGEITQAMIHDAITAVFPQTVNTRRLPFTPSAPTTFEKRILDADSEGTIHAGSADDMIKTIRK